MTDYLITLSKYFRPNKPLYQLVLADEEGNIQLLNAHTGKLISTFDGDGEYVINVKYSPDGKKFFSGGKDQTIKIWDVHTQTSLEFDLEYGFILTPPTVITKPCRILVGHDGWVNSISPSPDNKYIASGSSDRTIKIWNTDTGLLVGDITKKNFGKGDSKKWIIAVCYSSTGKQIASAGSDNNIDIWDAHAGMIVSSLDTCAMYNYTLNYSPDNTQLISSGANGKINMWDLRTNTISHILEGHSCGGTLSACFSPDGNNIVSGGFDETVYIWDVRTGKLIKSLYDHLHWVRSVCYSPDGRNISSGSADGNICVYDATTYHLIRRIETESKEEGCYRAAGFGESSITSICYSPILL
jgi:WD40 repeat protein